MCDGIVWQAWLCNELCAAKPPYVVYCNPFRENINYEEGIKTQSIKTVYTFSVKTEWYTRFNMQLAK